MNRTKSKRALMVAVVAWVLLFLLALASTSGVLAALITYDFAGKVAGRQSRAHWRLRTAW